jgi:hypothetical protein
MDCVVEAEEMVNLPEESKEEPKEELIEEPKEELIEEPKEELVEESKEEPVTIEFITENPLCKILSQIQEAFQNIELKSQRNKKHALYFIALEDNNTFLYLAYKKPEDQILYQCERLYDYAKLYKPLKIVFTLDDCELTDADKYVKQFMQLFGEDTVRGGSYTDIILPEWQKKALDLEFEVASLEKLDEIESQFY